MKYYFSGNKSRPMYAEERAVIGIDNARMWGGRLVIPIEADTREDAWRQAYERAAEYEAKTGVRVSILGWSTTNHYNI